MTPDTPGSQSALREANQRRVLRALGDAGSLTQAQIARATRLSAATVSNIVRQLRDAGMVTVTPTSSAGRRAQSVSLAQDTGLMLGLQVSPSHMRAAVCDMACQVLASEQIPYQWGPSAERGLRRAEWLVSTLLRQARVDRATVTGAAVALPGPVDAGRLGAGSLLASWQGMDVATELSARIGMPVQVCDEAHAAALGELTAGAGRGSTELAYLTLSSSVSAALVINGEAYQGSGGLAGQFGHITVNDQGRICRCGNRGCLETVVGGPYLLDLLPRRPGAPRPTLEDLIVAALGGDLGSRRVIADAGRAVGAAAAMLCNLLNPQRLIVGGELAAAGELLLDPLRELLARQTAPNAVAMVEVAPAELGEWSAVHGALGAAVRARSSDVAHGRGWRVVGSVPNDGEPRPQGRNPGRKQSGSSF